MYDSSISTGGWNSSYDYGTIGDIKTFLLLYYMEDIEDIEEVEADTEGGDEDAPEEKGVNFNVEQDILDLYMSDYQKLGRIDPRNIAELAARARGGEQAAVHEIVEKNLGLVLFLALKFFNAHEKEMIHGVSLMDLVQQGNLASIRAAEKYDPDSGTFAAYAGDGIYFAMQKYYYRHNALAIIKADDMSTYLGAYSSIREKLKAELKHQPTTEEVINTMIWPTEAFKNRFRHALDFLFNHEELYQMVADEDGNVNYEETYGDLPTEDKVFQEVLKHDTTATLAELLGRLGDREREVIRLRFGLETNQPHTLQEIGDMYGVGRERIRQIEARALRKLRKAAEA